MSVFSESGGRPWLELEKGSWARRIVVLEEMADRRYWTLRGVLTMVMM